MNRKWVTAGTKELMQNQGPGLGKWLRGKNSCPTSWRRGIRIPALAGVASQGEGGRNRILGAGWLTRLANP